MQMELKYSLISLTGNRKEKKKKKTRGATFLHRLL